VIRLSAADLFTMRKIVREFKGNSVDSGNESTKPGLDLGYCDV